VFVPGKIFHPSVMYSSLKGPLLSLEENEAT
jgi:hypothetical protein